MKLSEARKLWHRYVWWWKDGAVSGPEEWAKVLLKKDMRLAQLEAENERLSYLAYGPRHDSDCPALWGAGDCRCDLRERIDDWREERHKIDTLLKGE